MLNFIFIEVIWKFGYLRWLTILQEKWLRIHTSWPMQNDFFVTGCGDKLLLIKCEILVEVSVRIIRKSFQDPLQYLWLIGHRWSAKGTNFWGTKEIVSEKWKSDIVEGTQEK